MGCGEGRASGLGVEGVGWGKARLLLSSPSLGVGDNGGDGGR